ncbi:MAG: hypothetical protein HKN43_11805 [Rhodothermales bacterium]|nr:hypothetical protein [Rhodothermales bacterium]
MSDWQKHILGKLTLRQKIAQMISVRALSHFVSSDSESFASLSRLVSDVGIGGVTFFQGTVPGQAFYVNQLQSLADIPLLVAQDAENGIGMRLTDATILPHMMAIGATGDPLNAYEASKIIAAESNVLGVHHIFAPVADVNTDPDNPIINTRSFGSDPERVASFVVESVRGLQDSNVIATVKHFPGHGDTAIDTHLNLATLEFDRSRLDEVELVPFRAAFEAGVRSCMVGHLSVPCIDPTGLPASLSRPIVTGLLRNELGYDGLIVTDALDMKAITNTYGAGEAAVMAVEAGVDMLLLVADEVQALDAIEQAVDSGRTSEQWIDASVARILREKEWCGLNRQPEVSIADVFSVVANTDHLSRAVSLASAGICSMDGLDIQAVGDSYDQMIVLIKDDVCSGSGEIFTRELSSAAPASYVIYPESTSSDIDALVKASGEYDRVVVAVFLSVRSYSGSISFPPMILAAITKLAADSRNIVVLFGSPYVYALFDAGCPCIATCSTSPASEIAAAEFLIRGGKCPGSLPVTLQRV